MIKVMLTRCGPCSTDSSIQLNPEGNGTSIGKYGIFSQQNIFVKLFVYLLLGRGVTLDYCLMSPYVSRSHLQVQLTDNMWFIKDLGSFNGTFVFLDQKVYKLEPLSMYELVLGSIIGVGVNPVVWQANQIFVENPGELINRN